MSKVVFVGNVPYDVEEDKLIPIFSTVGPIAGFRLMIEKDTGKSKGYAFCEYHDHDTAASAVRNLNGTEVNGRPLRIDLADSDPFFEGKTTQSGRTRDDGPRGRGPPPNPLVGLPSGVPLKPGKTSLDMITEALTDIPNNQIMDILGQMKSYVTNSPENARALFNAHPQLAYAFFQAMLINQLVDPKMVQHMLSAGPQTKPQPPPPVPAPAPVPYRAPPPAAPGPSHSYYPPPPAPYAAPVPPPSVGYPPLPPSNYGAPPPAHRPPPPVAAPAPPPAAPAIPQDQQAMLMQILALSNDQVNALPPTERATVMALRAQFGNGA